MLYYKMRNQMNKSLDSIILHLVAQEASIGLYPLQLLHRSIYCNYILMYV